MKFSKESGKTYEDAYGGWLAILKTVAESETPVTVEDCPRSWIPFVMYLGGQPVNATSQHAEDFLVGNGIEDRVVGASRRGQLRALVEMCASIRPELIDALWKSDCQWKTVGRWDDSGFVRVGVRDELIPVANYGAFTRPEFLEYDYKLQEYVLNAHGHFGCVISACAADKPYPSPHHEAIGQLLPDKSWHQVVATGVLGIVPEELWSTMPLYDSGMPNLWRCMAMASWYFAKVTYVRIVVYADFYNRALAMALAPLANTVEIAWVHSVGPRAEYTDLCAPESLARLDDALKSISFGGRPVMMRS